MIIIVRKKENNETFPHFSSSNVRKVGEKKFLLCGKKCRQNRSKKLISDPELKKKSGKPRRKMS
jgi:hypothetical protein